MNDAYLALGSNVEPEKNRPAAIRRLRGLGRVKAVSTVWQSAALGAAPQPDFLNAVVRLETALGAAALQDAAHAIETGLGRRRTADKFGPRTIDIDLVLFNRESLQIGSRRIPDPDIAERPFLAVPLAELDPDYIHPVSGRTLAEMARPFAGSSMKPRPDVRLTERSRLERLLRRFRA
jgi:2-amino-4-hydroxy-6-hydroxymethyldihydropteridine diphosphokinase